MRWSEYRKVVQVATTRCTRLLLCVPARVPDIMLSGFPSFARCLTSLSWCCMTPTCPQCQRESLGKQIIVARVSFAAQLQFTSSIILPPNMTAEELVRRRLDVSMPAPEAAEKCVCACVGVRVHLCENAADSFSC
jgi:hypothetical protein